VLSTGWISADMKCFPQAPFFHQLGIFHIKSMLRTISKCVCIILINSYLHVRHHLPFKVSDLLASLNVTLVWSLIINSISLVLSCFVGSSFGIGAICFGSRSPLIDLRGKQYFFFQRLISDLLHH
jgi:hypothetical protein